MLFDANKKRRSPPSCEVSTDYRKLTKFVERQPTMLQELSDHQRRVVVGEALQLLSPRQYEVVLLAVRDSKTPTEMARALQISRSAVRLHLDKAAARLGLYLGSNITSADLCARSYRDASEPSYMRGGAKEPAHPEKFRFVANQ